MAETPPTPPSDDTPTAAPDVAPATDPGSTGDTFVYTDEDGVEHEMALVDATSPLEDDDDWSDGDADQAINGNINALKTPLFVILPSR